MKPTNAILGVLILAILSLSVQGADPHKLPPPGIHCLKYFASSPTPATAGSGGTVYYGDTAQCHAYAAARGYVFIPLVGYITGGFWRHPTTGAELWAT